MRKTASNQVAALVTLCLSPLFIGASSASPIFRILVYAPVQEGSPLHTVGLQYDEGFIRMALLNGGWPSLIQDLLSRVPRPSFAWAGLFC